MAMLTNDIKRDAMLRQALHDYFEFGFVVGLFVGFLAGMVAMAVIVILLRV